MARVIEFLGMPKAGKSTAIEFAESYLKHAGKKVRVIYEGARISPLDKSDRFNYNSWSFHNTLNRLMESRLDSYDFVLIDRGVFDHIAFGIAIETFCSERSIQIANEYYKLFSGLEDEAWLFGLPPDEAVRRERKHNPLLGRVFDLGFLSGLAKSYRFVEKEILSRGIQLQNFDGMKSIQENQERIKTFLERGL